MAVDNVKILYIDDIDPDFEENNGQQRSKLHVIEIIIKGVADRLNTYEDNEQDEIDEVRNLPKCGNPECDTCDTCKGTGFRHHSATNFRRGVIAGAASMIQILNDGQPANVDDLYGVINLSFADVDCNTENTAKYIEKAIASVMEICFLSHIAERQ